MADSLQFSTAGRNEADARSHPWGMQGGENFAFPEALAVASSINSRIRGLRSTGLERRP